MVLVTAGRWGRTRWSSREILGVDVPARSEAGRDLARGVEKAQREWRKQSTGLAATLTRLIQVESRAQSREPGEVGAPSLKFTIQVHAPGKATAGHCPPLLVSRRGIQGTLGRTPLTTSGHLGEDRGYRTKAEWGVDQESGLGLIPDFADPHGHQMPAVVLRPWGSEN